MTQVSTPQVRSGSVGDAAAQPASSRPPQQRRDAYSRGLALIQRISTARSLDRFGLRPGAERALYHATRTGMTTAATVSRTFASAKLPGAQRLERPERSDLFDLSPTADQEQLLEVVREVAAEAVRPAAAQADRDCRTPTELITTAVDLGLWQLALPPQLGGFVEERSCVTSVLVTEALAHGDLSIALALLAPAAVVTALSTWGDAEQQGTYLPAFTAANPPQAALAITEPHPQFDPFALRTRAVRTASGYRLDGLKSLVPSAAAGELFLIAAAVDDSAAGGSAQACALFLVESAAAGLQVTPEPAMGLRAAATGQVHLDGVQLPLSARLGTARENPYAECVRLARLGWCALAVGTAQAVLDYVIPYVNERVAFGEPISHRQSVAFMIADMATELDGMRLATYRAAARADQGLDYRREGALARRLCSEYGMSIGSNGVQLLGGHGFVKEHPVERWYRDLRAVGLSEGMVLV